MKKLSLLFVFSFVAMSMFAQMPWNTVWANFATEPDYANTPYEKAEYMVYKAPASWAYGDIQDAASFDATWDILGDSASVADAGNVEGGEIFDLGEASPSFGSAWKAVYDADNLYVLLKYWDLSGQADDGSLWWEVMAQPAQTVDQMTGQYAPMFDTATTLLYQNRAYARWIQLGGGKTDFTATGAANYNSQDGSAENGSWSPYEPGLTGLALASHFWNDDAAGVIRAVLVMDFASTLSYPTDPADLTVTTSIDPQATVGNDTIQFDVKSNATVSEAKVEYWWSANENNGYTSNYYSGMLIFSDDEVGGGTSISSYAKQVPQVYLYNDVLTVKGSKPANVEVFTITGSRVKTATQVNEVSMRDLNNGVYIVRLNGAEAYKVVK